MKRVIYLPALDKYYSLGAYVAAIKKAKAHPNDTFPHTLEKWWPGTGAEVVEEFRKGMHDRINQAVPAIKRGRT